MMNQKTQQLEKACLSPGEIKPKILNHLVVHKLECLHVKEELGKDLKLIIINKTLLHQEIKMLFNHCRKRSYQRKKSSKEERRLQ